MVERSNSFQMGGLGVFAKSASGDPDPFRNSSSCHYQSEEREAWCVGGFKVEEDRSGKSREGRVAIHHLVAQRFLSKLRLLKRRFPDTQLLHATGWKKLQPSCNLRPSCARATRQLTALSVRVRFRRLLLEACSASWGLIVLNT